MLPILQTATLVRRGICQCGFPVIKESVPDGKQYTVDIASIEHAIMWCGGCGRMLRVKSIFCLDTEKPGRLPLEIFQLPVN